MDFLNFLNVQGLQPHGYCLQWNSYLMYADVFANATIAFSYFIISSLLGIIVVKRKYKMYWWLQLLFVLFIMSCGITHLIDVITIWYPVYRISIIAEVYTAIMSITAALYLLPVFLGALRFEPTVAQEKKMEALNEAVEDETLKILYGLQQEIFSLKDSMLKKNKSQMEDKDEKN